MPKRESTAVPARTVRVGDLYEGKRVVKVRTALKYVYLTVDSHGAERRVPLNEIVEVMCEVPTDEELAAKEARRIEITREAFVMNVREISSDAVKELEAAEKRRAERIKDGWVMLDYSSVDDLLEAWAFMDAARPVTYLWESFDTGTYHRHAKGVECEWERTDEGRVCVAPKEMPTEYEMAVTIITKIYEDFVSRAKQSYRLSRSTSVISNMCEDLAQLGRLKALKSLRYSVHGLPEIEHFDLGSIY